jgi:hypothetical protein
MLLQLQKGEREQKATTTPSFLLLLPSLSHVAANLSLIAWSPVAW